MRLYGRRGCHLCERLRAQLKGPCGRLGVSISEFDVDEEQELRRRYGERLPVLLLDALELGDGATPPERLVARLEAAIRSRRGRLTVP